MHDINSRLALLKRPKLLVQAAVATVTSVSEHTLLSRVIRSKIGKNPVPILSDLIDIESELNQQRKTGQACYSPTRHVNILAAVQLLARRCEFVS